MSRRTFARGRDRPCRAAALHSAVALAVAALACASDPYEAYRSAHPGWHPALPEAASAEEVVAALHAPDDVPGARVTLEDLEVFDVAARPWRAVPMRAVGQDRERDGDLAMIAERYCRARAGPSAEESARVDYYLVRGGRVIAYAHTEFQEGCIPRERFRAARAEVAALELDLLERIRRAHGRRRLELVELYGRGLAYVEAGRMVEARAWLQVAERSDAAAREALRGDDRRSAELAEASALRERLRRALGLAPDGSGDR